MNYRQPTSTSTVQISAEPANKTSKSRVARSSPIVKEAIFTAVQSGNHYGTEKKKKKHTLENKSILVILIFDYLNVFAEGTGRGGIMLLGVV